MEYASQTAETPAKRWGRTDGRPRAGNGLRSGEGTARRQAESQVAAPRHPIPADEAGREQLMLEHMPAVRWMARRIHERLPQHVDMEDLVSAGTLGLLDAFRKFDPAKKVQFRSYAQFRIRGAILDSLRTLDWSPRDLRRKGRAVEEAIRRLTAQYGRAPTRSRRWRGRCSSALRNTSSCSAS